MVALLISIFFTEKSGDALRKYTLIADNEVASDLVLTDVNDRIAIMFVGDMMFDRYIRQVSRKKGSKFLFQESRSVLQDQDMVVGNLEGPITNNVSLSEGSEPGSENNYVFTFPPDTAKNLFDENIRLVNIGNNHILNFGENGVNSTKKYLMEAGVDFFGDPLGKERIFLKELRGLRIAFVNYNQFFRNGKQRALNDLRRARELSADFIVVYAHWGVEYADKLNEKSREMAYEFIDNGADFIVGSHPHVVQTKEEYKGKIIYYSLGNFVFDQYFDAHTKNGLAVRVEFDRKKNVNVKEIPLVMKSNGQTIIQSSLGNF